MAPVTSDIYNWEKRYDSAIKRLQNDPAILRKNRAKIVAFLQSREARGLSIPRIVKYGNHLIVAARLCTKKFEAMRVDDVRELLVKLKNREKESKCWKQTKGEKYSDHTLSDIKSMLKVFWGWMKGMDEVKPIYPPEANWFTKGRYKSITVTRSDLLTEEEVDLLAKATEDAQDAAFIEVIIDDKIEKRFRRAAMRRFGYGRGALSEAAEAAFAEWSSKEDVDDIGSVEMDDPVAAIEGLLKHVTKSSVELQHEASKIRVRGLHGKSSN